MPVEIVIAALFLCVSLAILVGGVWLVVVGFRRRRDLAVLDGLVVVFIGFRSLYVTVLGPAVPIVVEVVRQRGFRSVLALIAGSRRSRAATPTVRGAQV